MIPAGKLFKLDELCSKNKGCKNKRNSIKHFEMKAATTKALCKNEACSQKQESPETKIAIVKSLCIRERGAVEKQENVEVKIAAKIAVVKSSCTPKGGAVKNQKSVSQPNRSHKIVMHPKTWYAAEKQKSVSRKMLQAGPRYTPGDQSVAEKQMSMSKRRLQTEPRYTPDDKSVAEEQMSMSKKASTRNSLYTR